MAYEHKHAPASRQSVAYDYATLQQQEQDLRQRMRVHKGKVKPKVPYGKYSAIFCGVFAALLVIVFNFMQLTQLTGENAALKDELETLQSDAKALEAKKEQIFNLTYVEDRARNALGMIKADKSQVEYVDLSQEDSVEIPQQESETPAFLSSLMKTFNAVVEYLK